jgi:putative transposase
MQSFGQARCRPGRPWLNQRWDDLRLVGLKLIFLVVTRAVSVLDLSRRRSWWKDAEILMLRHQLAIAQRERPCAHSRLTWPDRAWLAPGRYRPSIWPRCGCSSLPARSCAGIATSCAAGGRGSRAMAAPAGRRCTATCDLWCCGWRGKRVLGHRRIHGELAGLGIKVALSTVWQILKSTGIDPAPRRDSPGWRSSCDPRRRGPWRWTSSPPACSTAPRSMS